MVFDTIVNKNAIILISDIIASEVGGDKDNTIIFNTYQIFVAFSSKVRIIFYLQYNYSNYVNINKIRYFS